MDQRPLRFQLRSRDQIYFLHIPKTAGTTFYAILSNQFPHELRCPPDAGTLDKMVEVDGPRALDRFKVLRSHQSYDVYRLFSHRPIFVTMLRDPVERIISVYEHVRRVPSHWLHEQVTEADLDLEDFIRIPRANPIVDNAQVRQLVGRPSRLGMICPEDDLLQAAMLRLEEFAFFGLVERFDESIQLLCYTFGWDPIREYNRLNVSPRPSKRENYPKAVVEEIERLNRLDMALSASAGLLFEQRLHQMLSEPVEVGVPALVDQGTAAHPTPMYSEEGDRAGMGAIMAERLSGIRQRWVPAGSRRERVYLLIRKILQK